MITVLSELALWGEVVADSIIDAMLLLLSAAKGVRGKSDRSLVEKAYDSAQILLLVVILAVHMVMM